MAYIYDSEVYNLAKGTKTGEHDKCIPSLGAPVEPSPAVGCLLRGGEHTGCVEVCKGKWGLIGNATCSRFVWMEKS